MGLEGACLSSPWAFRAMSVTGCWTAPAAQGLWQRADAAEDEFLRFLSAPLGGHRCNASAVHVGGFTRHQRPPFWRADLPPVPLPSSGPGGSALGRCQRLTLEPSHAESLHSAGHRRTLGRGGVFPSGCHSAPRSSRGCPVSLHLPRRLFFQQALRTSMMVTI